MKPRQLQHSGVRAIPRTSSCSRGRSACRRSRRCQRRQRGGWSNPDAVRAPITGSSLGIPRALAALTIHSASARFRRVVARIREHGQALSRDGRRRAGGGEGHRGEQRGPEGERQRSIPRARCIARSILGSACFVLTRVGEAPPPWRRPSGTSAVRGQSRGEIRGYGRPRRRGLPRRPPPRRAAAPDAPRRGGHGQDEAGPARARGRRPLRSLPSSSVWAAR